MSTALAPQQGSDAMAAHLDMEAPSCPRDSADGVLVVLAKRIEEREKRISSLLQEVWERDGMIGHLRQQNQEQHRKIGLLQQQNQELNEFLSKQFGEQSSS